MDVNQQPHWGIICQAAMHSMKKKKHSKRAKNFQGDRVAVSHGVVGKASPRR